ncbi:NADP-dependent oxidoreductase [Fictibacillus sp. KIGAM418]|uniref:NADP-dependent oxidoreductase n=1 Tax=Fictibacillus marinisediminis TaxID=2878389 RepID=A0A9X1XF21_9BACL|nr:NADP-dependent oxidoreductase [Fictibacillus marinisediminis]MCK6258428.1 NADP-dependent oxidoreductase [Fictibacillus marinisediminis]
MKAVVINEYGGRDQLVEKKVNDPKPGPKDVLIEIHATSVNPVDWKIREGYLRDNLSFTFPIILGWDAAGVVKETGSSVTKFKPGDEVFTRPATERDGTYAELLAADEELVAFKPKNLTYEEAASIPLVGLTAWQCLVEFAHIQEEQRVLIHAGGGGVGSFAIQLAKAKGAYVLSTGSKDSEEIIKESGADEFIDYKVKDFAEAIEPVDIVFDTIGGEVQHNSYKVIKPGGILVSIVSPPVQKEATNHSVKAGFVFLDPDGDQLAEIGKLIEAGKIKPFVGETFPLTQEGVRKAHELSESHHAKGKIIIQVKS